MGEAESAQFLSSRLASDAHVSASTQNQALNALLFLYRKSSKRRWGFAGKEWGWQWVFPGNENYVDGLTGENRRHHLHETVLQKAFKEARIKAGIFKPAGVTPYGILSLLTCWKMVIHSNGSGIVGSQ